ncbi:unnamed protein product [Cylicocyclus nassatus]|uniref:SCP domain-containing protein n=1 Tax=Cylicocyclus nassatus TaxID=53992 RepID=A0AA36GMK2_CYLNA|nr:unnamed protein product [Cylicocyclus nassatus]
MLIVLLIGCILQKEVSAASCKLAAALIEATTAAHNTLRAKVAQRVLDKNIYGDLPGTKSLFKLKYDCTNEAFALATIGSDCKHSSVYTDVIGRGENFITYKATSKPGNAKLSTMFGWAVEDWGSTVETPLSADVKYTDTIMEPFANIVYNKTLKFGCAYRYCDTTSKVAIACVYEERPQEGEPLYSADSTSKKGCTTNNPCKKIIKGAVCENNDGNMGPLCEQDPPSTTTSTISTTISTTTSTATDKSSQKESSEVTTASSYMPSRYVQISIKNGPNETKTFFMERHKCA